MPPPIGLFSLPPHLLTPDFVIVPRVTTSMDHQLETEVDPRVNQEVPHLQSPNLLNRLASPTLPLLDRISHSKSKRTLLQRLNITSKGSDLENTPNQSLLLRLSGRLTSPRFLRKPRQEAIARYITLINNIESHYQLQSSRAPVVGGDGQHPVRPEQQPVQQPSVPGGNDAPKSDRTPDPKIVDTAINDLISSLESGSERSGSVSGSDSEQDDELTRKRKRSVNERRLPWYRREQRARSHCNPVTRKTRDTLKYFSNDVGKVKRLISVSHSAPAGFPSSEWENIIKGSAVNLDVVLSSLHHVNAPKENRGRIGDSEVCFGRSEPVRKVETSGQWLSAWNAASKAIGFTLEHREEELGEYAEFIEGLFSSRVLASHPKVILFDKAVRAQVGGGQRILLTDTDKFSRLFSAILMPDGSTPLKAAQGNPTANTVINVASATPPLTEDTPARRASKGVVAFGLRPKYLRYNNWDDTLPLARTTAKWSKTASPLPSPPLDALNDPIANQTICEHPELFKIVTPINVDVFEAMLASHPNQPFVKSAIRSDLLWAANHIEKSSGVHLIRSVYWSEDEADLVVYCDACLTGMAYWYPSTKTSFHADIPGDTDPYLIFFFEALCVVSAILDACYMLSILTTTTR
ncbi:hypothetical protein D9615_010553 [Tricholomella constricta]|uniref:Uncharacterized protein n=1 Tax=Tricholomella constricta TaxID=117010 RepID=A0A8H5H5I6_9AGAR|nr:hypothetical protein D9615_010553 [Tricholomella constricta]